MLSNYARFRQLLNFLHTTSHSTYLFFSPTQLSLFDSAIIIITLILKSMWQAIGMAASIPASSAQSTADVMLPDIQLTMPLTVTVSDIINYACAINRSQDDGNAGHFDGPQLSLFLSAVTEPALLLLLAHRSCPLQPFGAINVRNKIVLERANLVSGAKLLFANRLGVQWLVTARLLRGTRWVNRGLECDFEVVLLRIYEGVEDRVPVFRQVFTMLQSLKHNKPVVQQPVAEDKYASRNKTRLGSATIRLDSNAPSKWAAVRNDYNPIHTSYLMARVFGMPGKMVRGNHVLANAIDALEDSGALPWSMSRGSVDTEVEFKKPVVVPVILAVTARENDEGGVEIRVLKEEKVVVEAKISRVEGPT